MKLAGLRYLRDVEEREASRLRAEAERLSRAAKRRLRRRRQPRLPIAPKPLPPGIVLQVRGVCKKDSRGKRAQNWERKFSLPVTGPESVQKNGAIPAQKSSAQKMDTARVDVRMMDARSACTDVRKGMDTARAGDVRRMDARFLRRDVRMMDARDFGSAVRNEMDACSGDARKKMDARDFALDVRKRMDTARRDVRKMDARDLGSAVRKTGTHTDPSIENDARGTSGTPARGSSACVAVRKSDAVRGDVRRSDARKFEPDVRK